MFVRVYYNDNKDIMPASVVSNKMLVLMQPRVAKLCEDEGNIRPRTRLFQNIHETIPRDFLMPLQS